MRVAGLGIVALLLAICGCASTRISSQADPTMRGATYDTLMVFANFEDLELRQLGENELKTRLAARGVVCHRSLDLFFPGGTTATDDATGKLAALGIRGILVVAAYDAGVSDTYVPPTYYTKGNAWVSGNRASGSATTYTTGGGTYHKPWAKFQADLFDVSTERRTWLSTANTKGNAYASSRTLVSSLCAKVVDQLSVDGLVPPPNAAQPAPQDK